MQVVSDLFCHDVLGQHQCCQTWSSGCYHCVDRKNRMEYRVVRVEVDIPSYLILKHLVSEVESLQKVTCKDLLNIGLAHHSCLALVLAFVDLQNLQSNPAESPSLC